MDIGPYFKNLPTPVTVTLLGGKHAELKAQLLRHDSQHLLLMHGGEYKFIPWTAVEALSVERSHVTQPDVVQDPRGDSGATSGA